MYEKIKLFNKLILLYICYIKLTLLNNIIIDGTLESDTLSHVKDLKKSSLKRKIKNECFIENEYNSDEECVKKKKRFSKYFNIAAIIRK